MDSFFSNDAMSLLACSTKPDSCSHPPATACFFEDVSTILLSCLTPTSNVPSGSPVPLPNVPISYHCPSKLIQGLLFSSPFRPKWFFSFATLWISPRMGVRIWLYGQIFAPPPTQACPWGHTPSALFQLLSAFPLPLLALALAEPSRMGVAYLTPSEVPMSWRNSLRWPNALLAGADMRGYP